MDRLVLVLSCCVMAAAFRCPSSYQTGRGSKHEPSLLGRHLVLGAEINPTPVHPNGYPPPSSAKPSRYTVPR